MDPIASFQGLATGIDFRELATQIIAAESRPATLMAQQSLELDAKVAAWSNLETRISVLDARADALAGGGAFDSYAARVRGDAEGVTVKASSAATSGSHTLEVLQLAQREKLGSDTYADRGEALGLEGEFVLNGHAIRVVEGDSLSDIAIAVNQANRVSTPTGVGAVVLGSATDGYRLVLTADEYGTDEITLADGSAGLLRELGIVDGSTSLSTPTSDGARSAGFTSSDAAVGDLLGLESPPPASTVTIGDLSVTIDLANDSLDDIVAAIAAAAAAAGSNVSAEVIETDDGSGLRQLDIHGTTSFTDTDGVLELLGVVTAGRGSVAQQLTGAAFTEAGSGQTADQNTRLTALAGPNGSLGVFVGDTLTISGARGDGTTFTTTFTVAANSTYGDLTDALNSDGFGTGDRTATAAIENGALTVTDDEGGASRTALTIVANNEGGGTLDFGSFGVTRVGRDRQIAEGSNARMLVDGAYYERDTNVVNDVVAGVALTLESVTDDPVAIEVSRDIDAALRDVSGLINAFNSLSSFVNEQFGGSGADGGTAPPLSGDSTLRSIRTRIRNALESTIASEGSPYRRLGDLGIEVNRNGLYDLDEARLREAIAADADGVRQVFASFGTSGSSSLRYLDAGSAAEGGTYDVNITAPATRASVTGSGFGGTYVDDGTPDTLVLTDSESDDTYRVSLTSGMTTADVVDALNAEFATPTRHRLETGTSLTSDGSGTPANNATPLDALYSGATPTGVRSGDVLTISGEHSDGQSFYREWTVTDPSNQTVGDLLTEIGNTMGPDVVVHLSDGQLVAESIVPGGDTFTLSVTSDNAGGGTFATGPLDVVTSGRDEGRMIAENVGGQLRITSTGYGSEHAFDLSFEAGGSDGTAALGLATGTSSGTDVEGTIGGKAAEGAGRILTGAADTDAAGVSVEYTGLVAGAAGSVVVSRGIGAILASVTEGLTDGGTQSVQGIQDRIDTQQRSLDGRIEAFTERMELRESNLIRRFTALEEAMAEAQGELSFLQSMLGSLTQSTGN